MNVKLNLAAALILISFCAHSQEEINLKDACRGFVAGVGASYINPSVSFEGGSDGEGVSFSLTHLGKNGEPVKSYFTCRSKGGQFAIERIEK